MLVSSHLTMYSWQSVHLCYNMTFKIVCHSWYITPSNYHHSVELFDDTENMDACQIYSVGCVSEMRYILTIIFYVMHGVMYYQRIHLSFEACKNIYTLCYNHQQYVIINKSEIWFISHCFLHTMVCVLCFTLFLSDIEKYHSGNQCKYQLRNQSYTISLFCSLLLQHLVEQWRENV